VISKEDLAQMKRGVSMNKVNMNDYFDLGLSEDELGDWGLSDDDEKPAKKQKGAKGGKGKQQPEEEVKVAAVPEPRAGKGAKKQEEIAVAEPPAKRSKSEKAPKTPKADADSVVVSKKEWENVKRQLEKLQSLLPTTAAAAEPSLPPRPELKRTRTGSRASLLGAKLLEK